MHFLCKFSPENLSLIKQPVVNLTNRCPILRFRFLNAAVSSYFNEDLTEFVILTNYLLLDRKLFCYAVEKQILYSTPQIYF